MELWARMEPVVKKEEEKQEEEEEEEEEEKGIKGNRTYNWKRVKWQKGKRGSSEMGEIEFWEEQR